MSERKAAFPKISGLGGEDGMSLRDYFAAKAMQGYCTVDTAKGWTMEEVAHDAYRQADAMLKKREE